MDKPRVCIWCLVREDDEARAEAPCAITETTHTWAEVSFI